MKKCFSPPLTFCGSALCAPNWSGHASSRSAKAKKRKGVLWAVCDEWLLWAKIRGALVYSRNIMYHKFHLHFPSSQITFYPIRRCFLCWLKGTLKQTVFAAAATLLSLSSSYTASRPHFSDFFPSPGWSVISFPITFHLFLPSPFARHYYRQGKSHTAEFTVCKCPAFVCNASTTDYCTCSVISD